MVCFFQIVMAMEIVCAPFVEDEKMAAAIGKCTENVVSSVVKRGWNLVSESEFVSFSYTSVQSKEGALVPLSTQAV